MQRKFGKKRQKYRKYRHRVQVDVLVYFIHREITVHPHPFMCLLPPAHQAEGGKKKAKAVKSVLTSDGENSQNVPLTFQDAVLASRNKMCPKWLQHPRERLPPVGGSRGGEEEEEQQQEGRL